MRSLAALLSMTGSPRATVVRAQARVLLTMMDAVDPVLPGEDPGRADFDALRTDLVTALTDVAEVAPIAVPFAPVVAPFAPVAAPLAAVSVVPTGPGAEAALTELRTAFAADREVQALLGADADVEGLHDDDAKTWAALHLACLRMPPAAADRWRQRLAAASGDHALWPPSLSSDPHPEGTWIDVPGPGRSTVLVPPLPQLGVSGVRIRPAAPLPPAFAMAAGLTGIAGTAETVVAEGGGSLIALLASLCAQADALAALDTTLFDLVAGSDVTRPERLDRPGAHRRYRVELLRRLSAAATNPAAAELIDLDEALCSLVHLPPAPGASWWDEFAKRSRHTVFAALTAMGVPVQPLDTMAYHHARQLSRDNVRCLSQRQGTVLRCLRMWAQLPGCDRPGRVVFGVPT